MDRHTKGIDRALVAEQLSCTLEGVDLPNLGTKYEGKVRDCYVKGDRRILITTDRLSAFDVVLSSIPFKGQVLTEMASYWFKETADIVQNHVIDHPHPNVLVTREVQMLPVEVVIRGYLTGSAWRDYQAGNAISGIKLPAGLKKSQRFPEPLITPSTKAEKGQHDEPISGEEIVRSGLVDKALWQEVCRTALELFARGTEKARERGLILVDTKYEFGTVQSGGSQELVLADEIHTPDSSRYWMSNSYEERFAAGEDPHMLDKEFVRRHLIEQGYMGEGTPPVLTDEFRIDTAMRYIEAFETVTGTAFKPLPGPAEQQIAQALKDL